MSNPIVSVAGLRGIVGDSFTPDVILPYVAAFADLIKKKRVVVGGDSRPSREWAQPVVESVLRARGIDVISVGLTPTPTIGMMVRHFNAGGGIAITASHNPIEWNGLKFFQSNGEFLTPTQNVQLQGLIKKPAACRGKHRIGKISLCAEALQIHMEKLLHVFPPNVKRRRKLRVVLDCCNGAASIIAPLLASSYGIMPEVIFANPGRPFPRGAEPLPQNLKVLSREVKRFKADFGAAIDPDADRLALVDETGRAIGEERTLVLAADSYMGMTGNIAPIVVNLSTTQAMDHVAAKYKTEVFRTKIGEAHVVGGMRDHKSFIGGEGNGGVIVPDVHPGRDAMTGMALIILGLQKGNRTLSKWNKTIPDFIMIKAKVDLGVLSVKQTLRRAKAMFPNAISIDETDGLKVNLQDSFVHLRPSGTEPILRIFVEAPDNVTAKQLMTQVQAILK